MKLQLKDNSVNLDGLRMPMLLALQRAGRIYQAQGMESLVVTSARDGEHMAGSLHYCGCAVDLRIWGLPDPVSAADRLRRELPTAFDVWLESTHLHVEFDPAR